MSISVSEIKLSDVNFPLLSDTKMSQVGIEKNGDDVSFNRLIALKTVLASVDLPPDPTTLLVDHKILLKDLTNTQTQADIRNDYFIINDTVNLNYYSHNSETLQVDNSTNPSYIRMNAYDGLMIQNDVKSGAPTSTNTFTHSNISIDNALGSGPTNTLTAGDMTINDFGSTNVTQLTADFLSLNTPTYSTVLNANSLNILDSANSYSSLISPSYALLNDPNGNLQTEIINDSTLNSQPYIRMQDPTGLNNYYYRNAINADGHNCFTLENNEKFFKQNNPFSYKVYELSDGQKVEKYMSWIFVQNVTSINLYSYTEYLDDNNGIGWSCTISNYSGISIDINTGGERWYSHTTGVSNSPIQLKKWSTCTFTLVYSSIDNEYLWALGMF